MNKIVLNIGLLLLALLGAMSCNIKEDMSDCPGRMILDYSAYPEEILDDIADDEQIDVFIFDPKSGICIDRRTFTYGGLREQGFEFKLPIAYRNYNAVVWQGLNSPNYESAIMDVGTSYDDFYLELDAKANRYYGEMDPLWATPLEPIEYCAKITRHRVYMTRIHTDVKITLQERYHDGSVVDLDMNDYSVRIEAPNGRYHTDHTLCEGCEVITDMNVGNQLGTLRITPDMSCILSVDGLDRKINLVDYMLDCKTDSSMSDQLFLDLNKVWDIKLIIKEDTNGYIALGISINGWVVWFSGSELS